MYGTTHLFEKMKVHEERSQFQVFISFKINKNRNWILAQLRFIFIQVRLVLLRRSLIKSLIEMRTTAAGIIAMPTR